MLSRDSEDENLLKICVWTCDMTSRSYFGKMNSTLGSVVPLAMFGFIIHENMLSGFMNVLQSENVPPHLLNVGFCAWGGNPIEYCALVKMNQIWTWVRAHFSALLPFSGNSGSECQQAGQYHLIGLVSPLSAFTKILKHLQRKNGTKAYVWVNSQSMI